MRSTSQRHKRFARLSTSDCLFSILETPLSPPRLRMPHSIPVTTKDPEAVHLIALVGALTEDHQSSSLSSHLPLSSVSFSSSQLLLALVLSTSHFSLSDVVD